MANYDSDLDKVIRVVGETGEGIRVSIHSYDEGPEKVGLVRVRTKKDGTEAFGRLGRLTMEELWEVIPLLMGMKGVQGQQDAMLAVAAAELEARQSEEEEVEVDAGELACETTAGPNYEPDPDLDGDYTPDYSQMVETLSKTDLSELATDLGIDPVPTGVAKLRREVAKAWERNAA